MLRTLPAALLVAASLGSQITTVIVVPSSMPEALVDAGKDCFRKVVNVAATGDRILLFEGNSVRQIESITVPAGATPRAKMRKMMPALRKVGAFWKRVTSSRVQSDLEQLRLPQLLSTVASSIRPGDGKTRVLVIGSPRYMDPRDSDSFHRGVVPNDAFITTSSDRSTYGTADRQGTLNGTVIHWAYISDDFVNERERRAIARFWHLYCSELGATLSSFDRDASVVVPRLLADAADPILPNAKIDRKVKELIMVRYAGQAPAAPKATPKPAPTVQEPKRSKTHPSPLPQARQALETAAKKIGSAKPGHVSIVALWYMEKVSRVDVDLYVKLPDADELYFARHETAGGRHLGDVRSSQVAGTGDDWKTTGEVIEVQVSSFGGVTCWLNLFSNPGGERVEGLVRLVDAEGRLFDVPFTFEGEGDGAAGRSVRTGLSAWREINLQEMLLKKSAGVQKD